MGSTGRGGKHPPPAPSLTTDDMRAADPPSYSGPSTARKHRPGCRSRKRAYDPQWTSRAMNVAACAPARDTPESRCARRAPNCRWPPPPTPGQGARPGPPRKQGRSPPSPAPTRRASSAPRARRSQGRSRSPSSGTRRSRSLGPACPALRRQHAVVGEQAPPARSATARTRARTF